MKLADYESLVLEVLFARDPSEAVARLGGSTRWDVYRRNVRVRTEETIEHALPRFRARFDDAAFEALVDAFLAARAVRSPYLRDLPGELLAFLGSEACDRGLVATLPAWAADLARYEGARYDVRNLGDEIGAEPADVGDLSMDRAPVLSPAHRVVRLGWSVHRENEAEIEPGAFALLVYRDEAQSIRVLELAETAAAIVEGASRAEAPLVEVVRDAARRTSQTIDGAFVASLTDLLADLVERGVWIGSRRT